MFCLEHKSKQNKYNIKQHHLMIGEKSYSNVIQQFLPNSNVDTPYLFLQK